MEFRLKDIFGIPGLTTRKNNYYSGEDIYHFTDSTTTFLAKLTGASHSNLFCQQIGIISTKQVDQFM